jgi:hypothetical protein
MTPYQEFMDAVNEDVNNMCDDILQSIARGYDCSKYIFMTGRKAKITIMKELLVSKMYLDHNIMTTIHWKRDKKDNDKYIVEFNYWMNLQD